MFLVVVLSEFRRCAPSSLLEYPVEIGYIIKSALITNLHDGHGAISKHSCGMPEPHVDDIL